MKAILILFTACSISFVACKNQQKPERQSSSFLKAFFTNNQINYADGGYYLILQKTGCLKCIQRVVDSLHLFESLPSFHIITDKEVELPNVNSPIFFVSSSKIRNANLELYSSTLIKVSNDSIQQRLSLDYDLEDIFNLVYQHNSIKKAKPR